jgi:hypothetical protein
MAQITLTVNNQSVTIDGEISAISQILSGLNYTAPTQQSAQVVQEDPIKFIDFFKSELESNIKGGKLFVSELERLYHKGSDYRPMIRLYHDLVNKGTKGWAKRRQLLLTTSAIWRYVFKPNAAKSRLRYQIEAIIECNDCGEFAKSMVQRMKKEKIWA